LVVRGCTLEKNVGWKELQKERKKAKTRREEEKWVAMETDQTYTQGLKEGQKEKKEEKENKGGGI
jgi:hypothetical protein